MRNQADSLRQQIYKSMDLKGTQELIEIWRANDRNEWSDDAFDAVREVLQNRNVEIPEQLIKRSNAKSEGNKQSSKVKNTTLAAKPTARTCLIYIIGFAVIGFGYAAVANATLYNMVGEDLVIGLGVIGITLFLMLFYLAGLFSNKITLFNDMRNRILIVFILDLILLFGIYQSAPKSSVSLQIANALLPACSGAGVNGTALYKASGTQHPTVIIQLEDGAIKRSTSFDLPDQSSLSAVQAVLCFNYIEVNIGYCNYDIVYADNNGNRSYGNKSIARIRDDLKGTLVAASTGQTITTFTLNGGIPPNCPDAKDVSTSSPDAISFGTAGINNVNQWLAETYK